MMNNNYEYNRSLYIYICERWAYSPLSLSLSFSLSLTRSFLLCVCVFFVSFNYYRIKEIIIKRKKNNADVYECNKMPKNPLSIFCASYYRHHHVKFSGQENRKKRRTAILGNINQSESEIHQFDRRSILFDVFINLWKYKKKKTYRVKKWRETNVEYSIIKYALK